MANHYYTENPELAHDLESWSFPLRMDQLGCP